MFIAGDKKKNYKYTCVCVQAKFIFCNGFHDDSLRLFRENKSIYIYDSPLDGISLKYLSVIIQSRYPITKRNGCAIPLLYYMLLKLQNVVLSFIASTF